MEAVVERIPRAGRVLVIRLRSLGDCVLTTPALALLKAHRPDLRIGVAVDTAFARVFEGNSDVAEILPPALWRAFAWRPSLCLNLHGGTRSMILTALSGARWRAGFAHHRFAGLYNVQIPRAQEILGEERKVHTAEHLASAVFHLGVPRVEIPRAKLVAEPLRAAEPFVVIHPFASAPDKTWPAAKFLEVAASMKRLRPVFIGARTDDMRPFAGHRAVQGAPLGELFMLIRGASLFIGNDSGPAHVAAAFDVPLAVIFGNSDVPVWSPWKAAAEVIAAGGTIADVKVEEVLSAVERLGVAP